MCEFVTLCILVSLSINGYLNCMNMNLLVNNYENDIKTIEEVLRLSSKVGRLKYSLVQIPLHVCSTHCLA